MISDLLAGVVDNSQSGSNQPSNIQNTLGQGQAVELWIVCLIVCVLLLIIVAIIAIMTVKHNKEINSMQTLFEKNLSDRERELLLQYRELTPQGKTIIESTIHTLNENKTTKLSKDDGN